MITNKIIAPYILRMYTWAVLDQETDMQLIDGLVPIIPIEDEQKLATSGQMYAVYGYAENTAARIDQIHEGIFSLRITAPTSSQLGQFINVVTRAFESPDVAVEGLNNFSSRYPNKALEGIRFTFAKTSYVEGGSAPDTEGGSMDGVVNVSYRYINRLAVPVPASAKGGLWTDYQKNTDGSLVLDDNGNPIPL
jgi:hypothetical protein